MYGNGKVFQQDYAETAMWYRRPAEQGKSKGQFNLGALYYIGQGVEQDFSKAVFWFERAASQGHEKACWPWRSFALLRTGFQVQIRE